MTKAEHHQRQKADSSGQAAESPPPPSFDDPDDGTIDDLDTQDALDGTGALDIASQRAIEEMEEFGEDDESADVLKRMEQNSSFDKDEPDNLLDEVDPAPPRGD